MPLATVRWPHFIAAPPSRSLRMFLTTAPRRVAPSVSFLLVCGLITASTAEAQQMIGPCAVLPANNIWNTPVDKLPVLPNSASMITTIGASRGFHADFGAGLWDGGPIGIPFVTVT